MPGAQCEQHFAEQLYARLIFEAKRYLSGIRPVGVVYREPALKVILDESKDSDLIAGNARQHPYARIYRGKLKKPQRKDLGAGGKLCRSSREHSTGSSKRDGLSSFWNDLDLPAGKGSSIARIELNIDDSRLRAAGIVDGEGRDRTFVYDN